MLIVDNKLCIGCGVCEDSCAFGAISVVDGLVAAGDGCTLCGACVEACEAGALRIEGAEKKTGVDLALWSNVWVFAEFRHGEMATVTYELIGAGRRLADQRGCKLGAVLLGSGLGDAAAQLIARGADLVYRVDAPVLGQYLEDVYGRLLVDLVRTHRPEVLLAGATAIGRSLIPQVAHELQAGLTADCTELNIRPTDGALLQTRPAFGGNIMATIECPRHRPQMATVRPRVMPEAQADPARQGEIIDHQPGQELLVSRIKVLESVLSQREQVNIHEADVLVSGGRGLEDAKGFALISELAEVMGGAVGASRAAVDNGWIGYPHQVGQTGKTVAPRLYVACGISGAIQHLVGMQSAETIVAINRDKDAPIFDVATYGVVGDLFTILPMVIENIKERRKG